MANRYTCHQSRAYEEAPCDTCPLYLFCQIERTACPTFAYWCLSGMASAKWIKRMSKKDFVDKPTKAIYNYIYCGEENPSNDLLQNAVGSVTS